MLDWIGNFLGNDWTVAILGAVISGVILIPITYRFTKFLEKSKIPKEVKAANQEVLNLLSRIISESEIKNMRYIDDLTQSIARKRNVDYKLLNTPQIFVHDLVLNILETNYMRMNQKDELIQTLYELLEEDDTEYREVEKTTISKKEIVMMMLVSTVFMSMLIGSVYFLFKYLSDLFSNEGGKISLVPIFFVLVIATLASVGWIESKGSKKNKTSLSNFFGLEEYDDDEK